LAAGHGHTHQESPLNLFSESLRRPHQGGGEGGALRLHGTPVIPRGNDAFVFRQIDIGEVVGIGQGELDDDRGEQIAGLVLKLSHGGSVVRFA